MTTTHNLEITDSPTVLAREPEFPRIDSPSKRKIRIQQVRAQIRSLQRELYELTSARRTPRRISMRTWWGPCTRCGYIWLGTWINSINPPGHCARCHSAAWMDVPLEANDRRPDSEANPNWDRWPHRSGQSKDDARDRRRGIYPRVQPPEPVRDVPVATLADEIEIEIPPPPTRAGLAPTLPNLPGPPLPPPPVSSLSAQLAARRMNFAQPEQPERVVARHVPGQPIEHITDADIDADEDQDQDQDQIAQDESSDVQIDVEENQ